MKLRFKIIFGIIFAWVGLHYSWSFETYAISYDDMISSSISSPEYLSDGIRDICGKAVEKCIDYALKNPTTNAGGQSVVTIPKYTWIDGKYNLKYTLNTGEEHSVLVRCCMVYTNFNTGSLDYITSEQDGLTYILNVPYFSIYRDDGYYRRYYVANEVSGFQLTVNSDYISIGNTGQARNTIYDCTDSIFGSLVHNNFLFNQTKFYTPPTNSIDQTFSMLRPGNSDSDFYYWYNNSNTYTPYRYPPDIQIITNNLMGVWRGGSGLPGRVKFFTTWVDTNDSEFNRTYINNHYDRYNINNYSYNTSYPSNTKIDYNTVNNFNNGILSPYFDIDGKLIPDIDFKLPLDFDFSDLVPDLVTNITNRFGDMPDLNLPWDSGGNNYFDIDFPSDPGGGGGDLPPTTIDVNLNFPEFPKHTTTYIISAQSITNTTVDYINSELDENIIKDSQKIVKHGFDFWRLSGLLPVLIAVAVFGLFWRFTGE